MNRCTPWALSISAAVLFCACSSVFHRELRLTQDQLQERLGKAFPVEERRALVDLTFAKPRVLLGPGSDRIGLSVEVEARVAGRVLFGHMEADGGLAYRGERGEIVIAAARLRALEIDGLPRRYAKALRRAATAVAEQYFAAVPVYRLDPGDFEQALARLVLKSVEVRDGEVVVTIGL